MWVGLGVRRITFHILSTSDTPRRHTPPMLTAHSGQLQLGIMTAAGVCPGDAGTALRLVHWVG